MEDTSRLINQKPWQVIGTAVASLLILGLQGCTWLVSLGVSEKGKERCLQEIKETTNSFVSELSFRKCLKGIDLILESEEKESLAIAKRKAFIAAESKNQVYIKRWEADRQELNMALNYNDKGCDKFAESVSEDSLELNRSQCKGLVKFGSKPLKDEISSQCSMISEFESWYEWAILNRRQGPCDELMQKEIQDQ